ncbi:hypothetical protein, partial [Mucilaginibacter aquaedulcis]|uniref:hypothetical protein n=1 Tax=Mucilaginibacter aquaedulcis TaxID=1187081 RepID=UPI0025B4ECC5
VSEPFPLRLSSSVAGCKSANCFSYPKIYLKFYLALYSASSFSLPFISPTSTNLLRTIPLPSLRGAKIDTFLPHPNFFTPISLLFYDLSVYQALNLCRGCLSLLSLAKDARFIAELT